MILTAGDTPVGQGKGTVREAVKDIFRRRARRERDLEHEQTVRRRILGEADDPGGALGDTTAAEQPLSQPTETAAAAAGNDEETVLDAQSTERGLEESPPRDLAATEGMAVLMQALVLELLDRGLEITSLQSTPSGFQVTAVVDGRPMEQRYAVTEVQDILERQQAEEKARSQP